MPSPIITDYILQLRRTMPKNRHGFIVDPNCMLDGPEKERLWAAWEQWAEEHPEDEWDPFLKVRVYAKRAKQSDVKDENQV